MLFTSNGRIKYRMYKNRILIQTLWETELIYWYAYQFNIINQKLKLLCNCQYNYFSMKLKTTLEETT